MIRFALHKVWMRDNAVKLILLFLFSGNSMAIAQSPEATTLDLTESGRSYLEAVGRRVDSDIVYYNPNLAAPELTTREQPSARESDDAGASWPVSRHVFTGIAILILAGVLYQIWRFGAPVSVSLTSRPSDAARAMRMTDGATDAPDTAPLALGEILAISDYNAALVELARSALAQTAERNGMRWQTSWTARELLRRLPGDAAERLRPLVWTAEHVQFGNRDVSADEFTRYANDVAPLLSESAA